MPAKKSAKPLPKAPEPESPGQSPAPSPLDDPTFFEFVSSQGGLGLDPLSDEALRLQATFVQKVGTHPLDVLRQVMSSPFHKGAERVAAAKALLEYSARKPPSKTELEAKLTGQGVVLDGAALAKLSDAELQVLEKLLLKIGGPA